MSTTMEKSSINYFDRLPDEIVERIFSCFNECPPCEPHNHVRSSPNTFYFDYSLQKPFLKRNHANLFPLSEVCRRFYRIIKSSDFWERKCREDHILQPDQHLPEEFTDYEKLYVYNPFHPAFNLIEESRWRKDPHSESRIEKRPVGTAALYDDFGRLTPCRATSHMPATFYQRRIPLYEKRIGSDYIEKLRPVIEFSICVSPRWDCAAKIEIILAFSDGHRWTGHREFPQWSEQKWHRLSYRYASFKKLPSAISVRIQGRDMQFWAGFFGIKFAQPRIRFLVGSQEHRVDEESDVVIEPNPDQDLLLPVEENEIEDPTPTLRGPENYDEDFSFESLEWDST